MKGLLRALIQAESTKEVGELAAAQVVADKLARSGIGAEITKWDVNRANVVATIRGTGERNALLFVCHLDVVPPGESPWKYKPFAAEESDGRIYGRGSCDMKGGTAAIVSAMRETAEAGTPLKGDLILACTAGEETDSCGTLKFMDDCGDQLQNLSGVIIPEPTSLEVVTAHRGQLWLRITTRGKTAHGSAPHLGVNAIGSMNLLLRALAGYELPSETHELLGRPTLSVNTISGGKALNVVPDECSIEVDIRTLPNSDHKRILADIGEVFAEIKSGHPEFRAEVETLRQLNGLETDPDDEFVRKVCSVVGTGQTKGVMFGTDAVHLKRLAVPIVVLGPGNPSMAHQPDEYVEASEMERAAEIYRQIILEFLG